MTIQIFGETAGGALPLLTPLLQTLEIQGQLPGISAKPELWANAEAFEAELLAAIFDLARPGSLRQTAEQLQRLAMLVRDRTSNDMWRVLSQIDDRLATPSQKRVMLAGEAVGILNQTLLGLADLLLGEHLVLGPSFVREILRTFHQDLTALDDLRLVVAGRDRHPVRML